MTHGVGTWCNPANILLKKRPLFLKRPFFWSILDPGRHVLSPPLRDRVEDILRQTDLFVRQFSRRYGKAIKGVAPETLDLLVSHPWEGNIRELMN